jgi:hypothetical protein
MYRLLVVVSVLCLAGLAFAEDISTSNVTTSSFVKQGTLRENVEMPDVGKLQPGGEDIANATPIPMLPFSGIGNTSINVDDYDVACPYASSAKDAVYSYQTAGGTELVSITLCQSTYDTKLFVFEDDENTVAACNEDGTTDPCTPYTSSLIFLADPGHTYYIVVDGFECLAELPFCPPEGLPPEEGVYIVEVSTAELCFVECPDGAFIEGEPDMVEEYDDQFNGGCNTEPIPVFQELVATEGDCVTVCGNAGWYHPDLSDLSITGRDTDWYEVLSAAAELCVTPTPEWGFQILLLDAFPNCLDIDIPYWVQPDGGCVTAETYCRPTNPTETYWVWLGPRSRSGPTYPYTWHYLADVCGIATVIPTEQQSWGSVKDLYR